MFESLPLILALSGLIFSSILTAIVGYQKRKRYSEQAEMRLDAIAQSKEALSGVLWRRFERTMDDEDGEAATIAQIRYGPEIATKFYDDIIQFAAETLGTSSSTGIDFTFEEIQASIDQAVESFEERLQQIEERIPEAETVDKIASVNDAILGTQIEALTKTITNLENRILSTWDVAKIVFQIIAGFGVLLSIAFGIISYLSKTPSGG